MKAANVISRRKKILEELVHGPLNKPELVDRTDVSRSTVNRAVRELEEVGLVRPSDGGYETTLIGRLGLECHQIYRQELRDLFDAEDVLAPLPADCNLPLEVICESELYVATDPAPYRPMEQIHTTIQECETFRTLLPVLYDTRFLERCYEHAVTEGNDTCLVVEQSFLDAVLRDFPAQLEQKLAQEQFTLQKGDTPPYGLLLADHEYQTTVLIIIFEESKGPVHAVLKSHHPTVVQWAEERFENAIDEATVVTTTDLNKHIANGSGERSN